MGRLWSRDKMNNLFFLEEISVPSAQGSEGSFCLYRGLHGRVWLPGKHASHCGGEREKVVWKPGESAGQDSSEHTHPGQVKANGYHSNGK